MLETIKIDRNKNEVWLCGTFIIYLTPDISFMPNMEDSTIKLYPHGGTLCCDGGINMECIPYLESIFEESWDDEDNKTIYQKNDEALSKYEIQHSEFEKTLKDVDNCCDAWLKPLDKIVKEYEGGGWDFDYKRIFSNL